MSDRTIEAGLRDLRLLGDELVSQRIVDAFSPKALALAVKKAGLNKVAFNLNNEVSYRVLEDKRSMEVAQRAHQAYWEPLIRIGRVPPALQIEGEMQMHSFMQMFGPFIGPGAFTPVSTKVVLSPCELIVPGGS